MDRNQDSWFRSQYNLGTAGTEIPLSSVSPVPPPSRVRRVRSVHLMAFRMLPLLWPSFLLCFITMNGDSGTASATAGHGSPPTLGAPTDLLVDLVEGQAPPLVLVIGRPRPTFSFVAPGDQATNRSMTDYQIVVRDAAGAVAWDSGKTSARGGLPTGVLCGADLGSGKSYTWTVQYWSDTLGARSASSRFDIGLLTEKDWAGAEWIGAGQKQFKLMPPGFALDSIRDIPGAKVKLHVAAPGGAVVEAGGTTLGDPVGLSLWTANDKTIQYFSYDLTDLLLDKLDKTAAMLPGVIVSIGGGFFSSTIRPAKATNGARPTMCRILLLLDTGASAIEDQVLLRSSASSSGEILGRVGPVLSDDPWMGTTTNTSLSSSEGWAPAKLADKEDIPQGHFVPVPMPPATKRDSLIAVSATELADRPGAVLYTFPANIVGHASLAARAVSGNGWIRLEHCETWNHSAGGCIPFGNPPYKYPLPICGLNSDGTADDGSSRSGCDTYLVDDTTPNQSKAESFAPRFTWHGFQHVVVTPGPGVNFSGELDVVSAHWTTSNLSRSASLKFTGEGSDLFESLNELVVASQISNLAAFMPTDCPTREKHGWLADSQTTAEEAMYNLWAPSIYARYLSQIRDSQSVAGENKGFIASRVPGRAPSSIPTFGTGGTNGNDVSWSAAYPLDAGFLLRYYGDLASVTEHWPALMLYMDSQLRVARGPTYANSTSRGLPDFYYWGDWCAVEPRANATPGTGPQAAAANFLMALRAMVEIGTAVGDNANAARYNNTWTKLVPIYHHRFWNISQGTWASDPMELQTLTALSLAAGVGSATDRTSAVAALDLDVRSRGYHLTVGSAGVKWLLPVLSKEGKHETALKLAMQTSFPSWGWWIRQGATYAVVNLLLFAAKLLVE